MTHPSDGDAAVKAHVTRHWNGRAATFDQEPQHGIHSATQRDSWLAVLREWTGEDPRQVLDVGCGTGVISLLLADLGHTVVGVDVAAAMLDHARAKARRTDAAIAFVRGDAEALPVSANAVDLLSARHLVWTLPDPTAALTEWYRVLEPGGRILLIEGHWNHDEPWDEYERIHEALPLYDGRPPETMQEALTRVGFHEVSSDPLMDAQLWGRDPRHDYYLVSGIVPR